jgi:hypothetical protein
MLSGMKHFLSFFYSNSLCSPGDQEVTVPSLLRKYLSLQVLLFGKISNTVSNIVSEPDMVTHVCNPCTQQAEAAQLHSETLSQKKKKSKEH